MITKAGFMAFEKAATSGLCPRGHIDNKLLKWLKEKAQDAQACYIYPPLGSFVEHASGCDPGQYGGNKTRPSGFETDDPAHGTRQCDDPKKRDKFLIQWKPDGGYDWIPFPVEAELHSERGLWMSLWDEPTASHTAAGQDGQEEVADTKLTKRQERHRRSTNQSYRYRHWTNDEEKAMYSLPPPSVPHRNHSLVFFVFAHELLQLSSKLEYSCWCFAGCYHGGSLCLFQSNSIAVVLTGSRVHLFAEETV